MTTTAAREMFGLRDTDKLDAEGILSLIESTKKHLETWSLTRYDREEAERELEALEVLYKASL